MRLTLPFPPSANRYWRTTRKGRVYKAEDARDYTHAVRSAELVQRLPGGPPPLGPGRRVGLRAVFYFPSLRGDLDNRIKVLLDALQGVAYADDKQVFELHARRELDRENPRVEIDVHPFEEVD